MEKKFFLVVTENWYGGGEENIRLFSTLDAAQEYVKTFTQVDTAILSLTPDTPLEKGG